MLEINEKIWNYIISHTSEEDPVLAELNRETYARMVYPRMLSGHYQGRFLEMFSKIVNPEYILEIGTFTGYSAICLARGLKPGGILHTIENNDEIIAFTKKYLQKSGLEDKIVLHVGDALQIIPGLNIMFDLIYIDADKTQYPDYYRIVFDKLKPGGLILIDNVLWGGKVVQKSYKKDAESNGILILNEMIQNDSRIEHMILPIRDGVMLVRKI